MPQFDLLCYSTQAVWTCVIFFVFYFVLMFYYLPNLSATLKLREKRKNLPNSSVSQECLYSKFVYHILKI